MIKRNKKKLLWFILPSYLLVSLASLIVVALFTTSTFKKFYIKHTESDLLAISQLIDPLITKSLKKKNFSIIINKLDNLKVESPLQFTYISPEGDLIYDSAKSEYKTDNYKNSPEVAAALNKGSGVSIRFNSDLKVRTMYLALLHRSENRVNGIIRLAVSIKSMDIVLMGLYLKIIFIGLVFIIISVMVSIFVSQQITRPIKELTICTRQYACGNFDMDLPEASSKEIGSLILQTKHMSKRLSENITKLEKLEKMRKEFVANVSHELKTPITLIGGFSETLLEEDVQDPDRTRKFLEIIKKHSERINFIIEDLLTLSKIEQDEGAQIVLEKTDIKAVVLRAVETCSVKADEKNIKINTEVDGRLKIRINPPLIEQAVTNLLDNAVKYSPADSDIKVSSNIKDKHLVITVSDPGNGIEEKHLPYLFQRFYRVDQARSREQGGTGLGLAIVKHIAQAHGGTVDVKSEINKGTSFYIYLPLEQDRS